jgi:indole-3-glycerol phosphate synthase
VAATVPRGSSIRAVSKLSQAIAEGDGISILVEVDDSASAERAEKQGADGLVARGSANAVRATSQLPLLYVGGLVDASGLAADAVVVPVDRAAWDEGRSLGLECVVRVSEAGEVEHALDQLDPEVFLLTAQPDEEEDPLDVLLGLLHDVPAGKLAIAELHEATVADVAELERAGVDAVLVAPGDVEALVGTEPPEV